MKKYYALLIAILFISVGFSQPLTGTKTIKKTGGDYASFSAAITALNSNGVGTGGVTFDVEAGFVDSASNLLITDSTATAANPIVFEKSGIGNNPLIIAKAGTGTLDGIIKLAGVLHITFDKIDLTESTTNTTAATRMEWGFALLKSATKKGNHYVVIKNCNISLNKANTNATYGIYSANHTIFVPTELVVPDTSSCNTNNRFYSNQISNIYIGIYIKGPATISSALAERNNYVGVDGGNTILNFSGTGTTNTVGISGSYQFNMKIANNTITSASGSTATIFGIYTSQGTNYGIDIYNNTISVSSAATNPNAAIYGIYNSVGGNGTSNIINIYKNKIQNCLYTGTAGPSFYGITNSSSAYTVNIYENSINNDTLSTTGTLYGIYSPTAINSNIYSNKIYSIKKTGLTGVIYCIYLGGATMNSHDNLVKDISSSSASTLYGYYSSGNSFLSETVSRTTIYNLVQNGTGGIYAMYLAGNGTSSSIFKQVDNDSIYNLTAQGGTTYGIYVNYGSDVRIFNNKLANFSAATSSGMEYGIYFNSGTSCSVYNNFISDLKTPASTNMSAINGIYINGGVNAYVAFNTVFLNAVSTSVSTFGTAAMYASVGTSVTLNNNIFVNVSTTGPTGGKTSAYRRSGNSLTYYLNASDNNCFYAGIPSVKNVIFYDGTNFDSTITSYKVRMISRDVNSFTENPPFINSTSAPYNLHLSASVPTACEKGGSPVIVPISITSDIDGDVRNTNFPDVGADEGNFIMLDHIAPKCTYTPLINTALTNSRHLKAIIIDPSGVPENGTGMPVIYWKKKYNGIWNSVKSTFLGSNQFDFNFGSGVVTGDTVYYYIVAQDSASTPNIGAYPQTGAKGFSSNPPAVSTAPASPNFYVIIPGFPGGNYKIGGTGTTPAAGCSYVDLTAALNDISGREITGAINLILTKYYSSAEEDTFPLLVKSILGQDATNIITIKPDSNVVTSISRTSTTSIFKFNSANYFVLDGSNNGTNSRDLTITNLSTNSNTACIWIASAGVGNGCNHVTIKNCNFSMSNNTVPNFGISISANSTISSTSTGADNDNITIDNNQFTKSFYAIDVNGYSVGLDDNLTISNNIIGSSVTPNQNCPSGIILNSYVNNSLILQNDITGTNGTSSAYGLYFGISVTNIRISRNKIHDLISTSGTVSGIYSYTSSNLTFDNNILYNIISPLNTYGIYSSGGSNNAFYYNSVYLTGDRDAVGTTKASIPSNALYLTNTPSNLILKDNIFMNSQVAATNPTTAKSYVIYNNGNGTIFSGLNYNDYYVEGAEGVLGYQGGGPVATLLGWQSLNAGDVNSISADPQFNSPSNLQPSISSPVMSAGTTITGISTDITGFARSSSKPTIGAYETGSDVTGPAIVYTPFTNTTATTDRILTATITDPSGVPTTGTGLPVLYWKINSGSWTAVTAVSIGSNQYTFTFGSGVVGGDKVSYYIAAQDNYSVINVSVYPSAGASGFTANPPAVSTAPTNPSSYIIIAKMAGGNYNIGGSGTTPASGCTYVDLTAAFADIANKEITGPITLSLTSNYKCTEEDAFPIVINPVNGASATNTVTIKPASGTTDTISGTSTTSIINIAGADYITIDGSNNGTNSRDLLIQNTSTSNARATIHISTKVVNNGATFNTIKNTILMGSTNTSTSYVIFIGDVIGSGGADNDNITISNNLIMKSGYGVYSTGTTTGIQDNLVIDGNTFGDTALVNAVGRYNVVVMQNNGANINHNIFRGSNSASATSVCIYLTSNNGAVVSSNVINNIISSTNSVTGIYIGNSVINSKITSNLINGIKYVNTLQNGGAKGIDISTGNTNSNLLVANNMINGIFGSGTGNMTTNAIIGIRAQNIGGLKLFHNSVNLYGKSAHTGTTVCKNTCIYIGSTVSSIDLRNNVFSNSIQDTSGTNTSYAIYSDAAASVFTNLNHNNYYVNSSQKVLGYISAANDTTLTAWKTATGKDSNSFNVDPGFVSDVDLHASSAYLNNNGDTISAVTDDIDGAPRNTSHPDIGADEFSLNAGLTTLGSSLISGTIATIWGKVNPMNEYNAVISFEYGTTAAYGSTITANQSPLSGMIDSTVSGNLTGLLPNTVYHYRIAATTSNGVAYGKDSTFKSTVGIEDNKVINEATIYVNGKKLIVILNSEVSDALIRVSDLSGKEIFSGKMNGKQTELDLGNNAAGYYLVSIISNNVVLNKKLFVK